MLAGRVGSKPLRWITGGLIVATGIAIAVAGLNVAGSFVDGSLTVLAAGGLAAAAVAEAGLFVLARGLERLREEDRLLAAGRQRIEAQLEEHARIRAEELEHTLARERANANHELAKQERAFIRPSPAGETLGGVARRAHPADPRQVRWRRARWRR